MQFDEMGNPSGQTMMLLPGTACDYQTNFDKVLDRLDPYGPVYLGLCRCDRLWGMGWHTKESSASHSF